MESEQEVPNSNLRHDSAPGLRRVSSLFKRIMRKEDASANSNKNIRVEQVQHGLQKEAEDTDSNLKDSILSWIRSSSDISRSGLKDWRRGSGSSKASCSTVFSRERYSYGSTATNSTSVRRSSCLSSTASTVRYPRSGTFSNAANTPTVNENVLGDSNASGKDPQEIPEPEDHQPAPCPARALEHRSTALQSLHNFHRDEPQPGPHRPSSSTDVGHSRPYPQVTPPMHEPLRDTSSFWTASSRSTHVTEYDSATTSEYEDDLSEEAHILTPLTGLLLDKLLGAFYHDGIAPTPASHTSHGTPESSSTRSSQGRQSGETASSQDGHHRVRHRGATGQRDHEANDSGGEEEGGEDRPSKRVRNTPSDTASQQLLLACPFCKWKPLTYQRCYKYVLKDISRVKQHLRRSHKRPPYCPKCWQVFGDESGRDQHIRAESCLALDAAGMPAAAAAALEGITSAQQEQLERRVDKKLSRADQWYSMYAVLFPDCPWPSSPYVESDLSAELLSFQRFMGTAGLGIVEQTAREHVTPALRPQQDQLVEFSLILFQHAVPRILQRYEATRPSAAGSSADSGYGSTRSGVGGSVGGGRVSRESERPGEIDHRHVLRPHGQRSIYPVQHETMAPSSFMFGAAAANSDTGYQMFDFPPGLPTDELAGFDMGNTIHDFSWSPSN